MKYAPKEYVEKHKGEYKDIAEFIQTVRFGIKELTDSEANVHQVKFFEEVLAELLGNKLEPIYEIVERKKAGTDCTEAESAEVKGWLRDIAIPFPQPIFNEVKVLFPIEYNEFLEEVEVGWQESINRLSTLKPERNFQEYVVTPPMPERKYYVITCHVANVFTNDANVLTDAEFIEFAKTEGLIFTEAEFIETFNTGVRVITSQKQYLRII